MGEPEEKKVIADILRKSRVIAVVDMSKNPQSDSYKVGMTLREKGYSVIPVNPACSEIEGMRCYPSVMTIPGDIELDVVNIFKGIRDVPLVVVESVQRGVKAIWMQTGIIHEEAAQYARSHNVKVIMDRCMRQELCDPAR